MWGGGLQKNMICGNGAQEINMQGGDGRQKIRGRGTRGELPDYGFKIIFKLKADGPHLRNYLHTPTD